MTASIYDGISERAALKITVKGAPVVFLADSFRGGSVTADVTGNAVELEGDPDTYAALGVIVQNPVTLMVAARGLTLNPVPVGATFMWAARRYVVKMATPLAPDGVPILWTIVGVSG